MTRIHKVKDEDLEAIENEFMEIHTRAETALQKLAIIRSKTRKEEIKRRSISNAEWNKLMDGRELK